MGKLITNKLGPEYDEVVNAVKATFEGRPEYYLGPIILAASIENFFGGILLVQVWSYFQLFPEDRLWTKALVGTLAMLCLGMTMVSISYVYITFSINYGNYDAVLDGTFIYIGWILQALIGLIAQSFFLNRTYRLNNNNKFLLAGLGCTVLGGGVCGLSAGIWLGILGGNAVFADRMTNLIVSWKSLTVASDVVLTSSIIFALVRSRTGWARTDRAITGLIKFTMEAQILPTLCSILFLAGYYADPLGNFPLMAQYSEAKIYAISVTHVLNARARLRRDFNSTEKTSSGHQTGAHNASAQASRVRVQVETITQSDRQRDDGQFSVGISPRRNRHEEDGISHESFEGGDSVKKADSSANLVVPTVNAW